ncbi:hypothetical protein ACTNES_15890, partial [Blautia sp. HCP3S3_D9]|uniref:hypothetical protein n=1 Tax=Blautia sp. HCP3S3_D9 TaxID=3438912 RepID=UPI003F8B7C47
MNRIDICKNIIQSIKDYITTPEKLEPNRAKNHFVHFAPVSGHWCVCQWTLGATSGRKLIDHFVFDHNVIM